MCQFDRFIGIDYSGAKTPDSSLPGLRVFIAEGNAKAREIPPPPSVRKYWTRREITQRIEKELEKSIPTIIGIDHAFSFPKKYFARYHIPHCWDKFLDDFCDHFPTDQRGANIYHMLRSGDPKIEARRGNSRWKRQTEMGNPAKSVFHFDVPGQVASSTHAGLPFLRELRRSLRKVHFWPFDGWEVPHDASGRSCKSCIVEAYPRLYLDEYSKEKFKTSHQRDAYATAMWMRDAEQDGRLKDALNPALPDHVRAAAKYEGWILGAEC